VWIFGSRVKGGYRPDSDLDIAVEAEPVPDSEEALVVWMNQSENWKAQLQQKVSLAVDLDWFDPDGSTPRIYSALEEAKDLVYERALV
jgi:predicted nucleotidyltransferase